ncbi:hypothetical protein BN946_scf184798.g109 [Trametes cinnabarina]|uniref:Uncharacterized protein n=1 Tax=Pycnoporus cinnabarinus TaxID=5643 RepID=A0A060SEL0_PYCCI|nr:hypothetical protein BN946_scf184798.g109 [Trametes cinnabarina]
MHATESLETGLAGAVTSVATAGALMASAAQDRFVRLHSTFSPPAQPGQQQEHKGDVLDKLYVKVTPTVIVWDGVAADSPNSLGEYEGEDDVWDQMQAVVSDSEDEGKASRRKEKKSRTS